MAKTQDVRDTRWDDVRVFIAAYRDGSLGVAAGHLGLDVSTVSRRLTAFEEALDAQLFDRTRQGLVRLEAAEALFPAAEAMEAAHARLTREASTVGAEAEGVVRLSVPPGIADTFVAPRLAELCAEHPRLTLEIDASTAPVDLTRYVADIALRTIRPSGGDLRMKKLASARWVAVANRERAAQHGTLKRWDAIPWIAWDGDLASLPVARWLARFAPSADIAVRTSHFASQVAAARVGVGAVLIPEAYADLNGLVPLRLSRALKASAAEWPVDDLWLVSHRALRNVPRVDAVWRFLEALPWQ